MNATDDRHAFTASTAATAVRPVVEGKQIEPFRVHLEASVTELRPEHRQRVPHRPRLAYRDVASATNRLTLIAAVLPARAVTTHTLFCLKTPLSADAQHVLCALLNSYVANYIARFRVTTHVTAALMSRLPVPLLRDGEPAFDRLLALSRALAGSTSPIDDMDEHAELQALAARLYLLTRDDFVHVLSTFPLVPGHAKTCALDRFGA